MITFESADTDIVAVLVAYADARVVGLARDGQRWTFTVEVDRDRATAVRAAWTAHALDGNVYEEQDSPRQPASARVLAN